ncbi:polysaccharide deacetylase family protein [Comamonas sp.]|uniref:polysaccharide deacetylase family protein n=1 Tax=Comamonas sp. TaxID=34028 RepID=UPI00258A6D73|nr:polysaccharide deacetylase family protein [Comamonas sp.]
MTNHLTIVMYHYIRQLERTRYPAIKGLRINEFRNQLDYLQRNYHIISMADVVAAKSAGENLPPKSCLLTFDDGYIEHFTTVFPILFDRKLSGAFYPPVATIERGELLDVNRVHFLLSVADPIGLKTSIDKIIHREEKKYKLEPPDFYYQKWGIANRFDSSDIIYIKRMLQTVLPYPLRSTIARDLFSKHVSIDESTFAAELYLNPDQARMMVACGMHFGSHGDKHLWLNHTDAATQASEINGSLRFLRSIGEKPEEFWTLAYPFGGWNEPLLSLLRQYGCKFALTTQAKMADLDINDPLLLPRYDTNDFPK